MGIFDRLKKLTTGAEPADEPSEIDPTEGVIVAMDPHEGTGTIALESGDELRFWGPSCKGFVPAVGARVVVEEIGPNPLGGMRATIVHLAAGGQDELDALHDERNPMQRTDARAVADAIGAISFLCDDVPTTRAELRAFFERAGVLGDDVRLELEPDPVLVIGDRSVFIHVGGVAFTSSELNLAYWPEDRRLGNGFVCLATGAPSLDRSLRITAADNVPDPWGPGGNVRRLTEVSRRLAQHCLGVVVHRATAMAYPAETFLDRVGDLDDPQCVPFHAWISLSGSPDGMRFTTWGMSVSGHPDVEVEILDGSTSEARRLGIDAALYACYRMARENRTLDNGEILEVPDSEIAGYPIEPSAKTATFVVTDGEPLRVRPANYDARLTDVWRQSCEAESLMSLALYERLFVDRLLEQELTPIASIDFDERGSAPNHAVHVFERADGKFVLATCGLARKRQPGGTVETDSARLEFLAVLDEHSPTIATHLSVIGRCMFAFEHPWAPEHRVKFPDPIGPASCYALGWVGNLELGGGDPVTLVSPAPMTAEEAAMPLDDVAQWLVEHASTDKVRARWLGPN